MMTSEEKKQCVIELRKAFEHVCAADVLCGPGTNKEIVKLKLSVMQALADAHADYLRTREEERRP